MKKIVAVASLASLLAGATFAADISFSYTGNNYFQASGDNLQYDNGSRTDCMSFGLKTDYAGVVVDFNIEGGSLALDEYYAWMDFAKISTQFTAGVWSSNYADTVETDAGDLDGEDFIGWDMGVTGSKIAANSGNLTYDAANDKQAIAMVAAYTNKDALPGALMLKFGLVNADWDSFTRTDSDGTYTRNNRYGFVGEIAFRQDDVFNINFDIKSFHVGQYSFGLFFSPLMAEQLELTAGVTLGLDSYTYSERNKNKKDETGIEFAFDIRARYAVTEKFSITTAHNISSSISGLDTEKNDGSLADNTLALANQINATYAFLDNMSFGLNLQHTIEDFDAPYATANTLIISPSVAIAATEKATVTIAARGTWEGIGFGRGDENFVFTVPVIFSFNY